MEHSTLTKYRTQWVGVRVSYIVEHFLCIPGPKKFLATGVVEGVGDDGARCDGDARRRAKPTGLLFIRRDTGELDDIFDQRCTPIEESNLSHEECQHLT